MTVLLLLERGMLELAIPMLVASVVAAVPPLGLTVEAVTRLYHRVRFGIRLGRPEDGGALEGGESGISPKAIP